MIIKKIKCTKCKRQVMDLQNDKKVGRPKNSVTYISRKPFCNKCFCRQTGWLRDRIIKEENLKRLGIFR